MAGNAIEEGLLGQLDNPSHLDRGRIIVPAAAVCGLVTGFAVWWNLPVASVFPALAAGALVCGLVAWQLAGYFSRKDAAREAAEHEARRADQIAQTERALARMKEGTK